MSALLRNRVLTSVQLSTESGQLQFAAWVALCRVGGGALQVGWWCFAAQVALCLLGCPQRPQTRSSNNHSRGKAAPTRQSTTTRPAKHHHPRGKGHMGAA